MDIKLITTAAEARSIAGDVAALYRSAFGREIDWKQWSREYFDNPYGDPIAALGYEGGRLVGHHALMPQKLVGDDGCEFPYYLAISLMLHPEYRGFARVHALISATTSAARARRAAFLLGFPNQNSFRLFQRCFGWKLLVETKLYDWAPAGRAAMPASIGALPRLRLPGGACHPYDETFLRWRGHSAAYRAESVGGRLAVIYKLFADRILLVVDAQTERPELAERDLAALAAHAGAEKVRITGVHARAIGLEPAGLRRHADYTLRMCYAPIAAEPPAFRFSLLLTDVF